MTTTTIDPRFTFEDAQRAWEQWGSNCGPGALAVVAGLTLDELRPQMGDFERKGYTNPTLMFECLDRLGLRWHYRKPVDWPDFGLVRIQWEGPWMNPGVPVRARYRYTHWVASARQGGGVGVFDINCMPNGTGWVSLDDWTNFVAPHLIREAVPRGSGKWHLTHALEVSRP